MADASTYFIKRKSQEPAGPFTVAELRKRHESGGLPGGAIVIEAESNREHRLAAVLGNGSSAPQVVPPLPDWPKASDGATEDAAADQTSQTTPPAMPMRSHSGSRLDRIQSRLPVITQVLTCVACALVSLTLLWYWTIPPLSETLVEYRLTSSFSERASNRAGRLDEIAEEFAKQSNRESTPNKHVVAIDKYSIERTDSITAPYTGTIHYKEIEISDSGTIEVAGHTFPVKYSNGKWGTSGDAIGSDSTLRIDLNNMNNPTDQELLDALSRSVPGFTEAVDAVRK